MAYDVPSVMPKAHRVGTTFHVTREFDAYKPEDGWTATLYVLSSAQRIALAGSDNGDGSHKLTETAANTATWTAGSYRYVIRVAGGSSEVYDVEQGEIELTPDLTEARETRTTAQIGLDAINAAIAGNASPFQLGYTIEGVSVQLMGTDERIRWREYLRAEVAREKRDSARARGEAPRNRIKVRFATES